MDKTTERVFMCMPESIAAAFGTGVANMSDKRAENLSGQLADVFNYLYSQHSDDVQLEKFKLIGSCVENYEGNDIVKFNGVALFSDKTIAYTTIDYSMPLKSYTYNIKVNNYEYFDRLTKSTKPTNISVVPVFDFADVNETFTNNSQEVNGYKNAKSMLLNISTPKYDDSKNEVSFLAKTLMLIKNNYDNSNRVIIATNKYDINSTKGEYSLLKQNSASIFDYSANAIRNKDNSKIKVSNLSMIPVNFENTDEEYSAVLN